MLISEPKSLYEAFKPLINFNCFIGLGAARQPNQSKTAYRLTQLYTGMVTLINWTATIVIPSLTSEEINFEDTSPMAIAMYKILIWANACIAMIAPLLVWVRRKALKNCAERMTALDDTLQTVLGARNDYRSQYVRLIIQIVGVQLVMFLVGICDMVPSLDKLLQGDVVFRLKYLTTMYALHYPILVMLLLDINFCTFVGYLGKKFRDLNDSLLRLADKPISRPRKGIFFASRIAEEDQPKESDNHNLLREIRKAHLEVCDLSRKLNAAFGIQNLLSTGISFVIITGLSYTIYSAASGKTVTSSMIGEVISTGIWPVIYAFKIWMVNHSCWKVSNEAERTGQVIYELLNSRVDKDFQNEIQQFAVQMLQNPVRFNACGFFTLDHTFVQGVIGSVTTYLVILIQMSN